jgi:hypothetical protein
MGDAKLDANVPAVTVTAEATRSGEPCGAPEAITLHPDHLGERQRERRDQLLDIPRAAPAPDDPPGTGSAGAPLSHPERAGDDDDRRNASIGKHRGIAHGDRLSEITSRGPLASLSDPPPDDRGQQQEGENIGHERSSSPQRPRNTSPLDSGGGQLACVHAKPFPADGIRATENTGGLRVPPARQRTAAAPHSWRAVAEPSAEPGPRTRLPSPGRAMKAPQNDETPPLAGFLQSPLSDLNR